MTPDLQIGSSMAVHLHRLMGQQIVSGTYDGKPFPNEADLAGEFGASRTVVREAIKMLTAKGLINPRQSAERILPITSWNLLDPDIAEWLVERPFSTEIYQQFTQMRMAIEPVAAMLASQCQDALLIAAIDDAFKSIALSPSGSEARLKANINFHVAILRASGNAFFERMQNLIDTAIKMETSVKTDQESDLVLRRQILNAINERDGNRAETRMRNLLLDAEAFQQQSRA